MIRVDVSTVIDAPIAKVWDFMSDLGTANQRDPSVIKVDWQPPIRAGSVAIITHKQLGTRTARFEVKEVVPYRKLRAQVTSMGATLEGTYSMEQIEGDKTKFSVSVEVQVGGWLKLLSPYVSYKAKRDGVEEIERIKGILEGRTSQR